MYSSVDAANFIIVHVAHRIKLLVVLPLRVTSSAEGVHVVLLCSAHCCPEQLCMVLRHPTVISLGPVSTWHQGLCLTQVHAAHPNMGNYPSRCFAFGLGAWRCKPTRDFQLHPRQ